MGWLLDASPDRSYNRLAQRLLDDPEWPDRLAPRSLGNALRDLDQGERRDWLIESPARIAALARALGLPPERVTQHVDGVVPLADLPGARPLDLRTEELFPGLPGHFNSVEALRWILPLGKLWWHAPGGWGKTLVGRWLDARNVAKFVQVATAGEVPKVVADVQAPRVYVEVASPEGWEALLQANLGPRLVCVAAPFAIQELPATLVRDGGPAGGRQADEPVRRAVDELQKKANEWEIIRAPKLAESRAALVRWIADRYPADRALPVDDLLSLCEEWDGAITSPGDVIALAGLAERWGVAAIRDGGRGVLQDYLRTVLDRLPRGTAGLEWLSERAEELLRAMFRRVLADPAAPEAATLDAILDSGLARSEWEALVPRDILPPTDLEGLRAFVEDAARKGKAVDPVALKDRLSPGPDTIVRVLAEAHLLEARPDARLVLRPRPLVSWTFEAALDEVFGGGPAMIGEALLKPWAATHVLNALFSLAMDKDFSVHSRITRVVDVGDPELVAALEAAFLTAGLAMLAGAQVPTELRAALWTAQLRVALPGSDPGFDIVPRLGIVVADGHGQWRSVWAAAAIALSEGLKLPPRALSPWEAKEAPSGLGELLRDAYYAGRGKQGADDDPWLQGLLDVGARLFERFGPLAAHGSLCPAIAVPALVEAARARDDAMFKSAADQALSDLAKVRAEATRRKVPWEAIADAVWRLPDVDGRLYQWNRAEVDVTAFWQRCPPERLTSYIEQHREMPGIRWTMLTGDQMAAVAASITDPFRAEYLPEEAWRAMPTTCFEPVARAKVFGYRSKGVDIAWERAPELLIDLCFQLLDEEPSLHTAGSYLLYSVPDAHIPVVSARAREWAKTEDQIAVLRAWLQYRVALRKAGWREAYRVLGELPATRPASASQAVSRTA